MKLIDKIQKAHSGKLSDYSTIYTPTANAIEKIADNYAVEFAEWARKETYYENLTKEFIYKHNVYKNEKELLEIFKKEKGL